jgi:hypothetical protein
MVTMALAIEQTLVPLGVGIIIVTPPIITYFALSNKRIITPETKEQWGKGNV